MHTEIVYAVNSLPATDAHPSQVAGWLRGHWGIENRVHWVGDVTFDEDRSQVRTHAEPRVMATLRNTALSLLRLAGQTSIAAALRHHSRKPHRPINYCCPAETRLCRSPGAGPCSPPVAVKMAREVVGVETGRPIVGAGELGGAIEADPGPSGAPSNGQRGSAPQVSELHRPVGDECTHPGPAHRVRRHRGVDQRGMGDPSERRVLTTAR